MSQQPPPYDPQQPWGPPPAPTSHEPTPPEPFQPESHPEPFQAEPQGPAWAPPVDSASDPSDPSGGSGPSDPWTIETEPGEPAQEHSLRWVWALVAAVVAVCVIAAGSLVAVLIALDDDGTGGAPQSGVPSAAATGAMGPLLDRVQASEQVMKDFQQSAEAATSLQGLVDAGERGRDDLTERRAALVALTLAPPDGPVASARAAYLAHVDEWIEAMDAFASGRDSGNGDEIDSTFSAACDALRSAAREISDPGALDRVEDSICTDEAFNGGDDGPPGLQV